MFFFLLLPYSLPAIPPEVFTVFGWSVFWGSSHTSSRLVFGSLGLVLGSGTLKGKESTEVGKIIRQAKSCRCWWIEDM